MALVTLSLFVSLPLFLHLRFEFIGPQLIFDWRNKHVHRATGKTTTISMLAGYLRPSGGKATICGHDVSSDIHNVHKVGDL